MKPICVPCQRFFRPKKNGYWFIEGMPIGNGQLPPALPGTAEPQRWEPYKLWQGDLWQCEGCSAQIVSGVAHQPFAEHYQENFVQKVEATGAKQLQVNDC